MAPSTKIFGHEEKLNFLLKSYKTGCFPHGWLFYGRKGIGKYSSLMNFLQTIFGDKKISSQNIFKIISQ